MGADEVSEVDSGEDVLERLSRYRPYRSAAWDIAALKEQRDRVFFRVVPEEEGEQTLDLGDLYALCRLWWNLRESKRQDSASATSFFAEEEDEWSGVPSSLPEEEQIERKISEILRELASGAELSLSMLLRDNRAMPNFVVTILALLEMSRMGRIRLMQEVLFDDVSIIPA